jgi:16S rRNA processing protein RimM
VTVPRTGHPDRNEEDGMPDSGSDQPETVLWGWVAAPHGLRGALRVRPANPESPNLDAICRCFIETAEGLREMRVVEASAAGGKAVRIRLEGVDSIEAAQLMCGRPLLIAKADLPAPAEGEFYYFEVLGFAVQTLDGRSIGRIEEVFFNGAHDVWTVKGDGREVLVPVIEDVVKEIDAERRRALIDPIPGLLD